MGRVGLGLILALIVMAPSQASTYVKEKIRCPIGGQTFTVDSLASMTTFGMRPDGKPYGSAIFPLRLNECPGNKLLLYRDFTPAELKLLAPLIVSPTYLNLVSSDLSYYRASWLERQLRPELDAWVWLLLKATWEADGTPLLKTRYQIEFVAAATSLPPRPDDLKWLALQTRAANSLRELGRFDEAAAMLRDLPRQSLAAREDADAQAAENREGWMLYLKGLEKAVARRDASSEPLDMLPEDMATGACVDMSPAERAASVDGFCVRPEISAKIETIITNRALACMDMEKYEKDAWSDPMCAGSGVPERAKAIKAAKPGDPYYNATETLP